MNEHQNDSVSLPLPTVRARVCVVLVVILFVVYLLGAGFDPQTAVQVAVAAGLAGVVIARRVC